MSALGLNPAGHLPNHNAHVFGARSAAMGTYLHLSVRVGINHLSITTSQPCVDNSPYQRRVRRIGYVPAGVVAQTWRGSARQHAMVRLLRAGAVRVDPLSEDVAYRLGILLAKSGTSDVVDAHVALLARRLQAIVLTSDPDDLTALDDTLKLVMV